MRNRKLEAPRPGSLGNIPLSDFRLHILSCAVSKLRRVLNLVIRKELAYERARIASSVEPTHQFRKVPGLIQKYYVRHSEPGYYGGIYLWDSKASLQAFMQTELAATMSKAYKIVGAPRIEISGTLFKLKE